MINEKLGFEDKIAFGMVKGVFEKVTLGQLRLLLQEKLPCFPAGRSLVPTTKIDFHAPPPLIKF